MKFIEFASIVVFAAALTLLLLVLLIDQDRLCGLVSAGHRRCVVVVDRHE